MRSNEVDTGQDNNELKQIESINGVSQALKGYFAHMSLPLYGYHLKIGISLYYMNKGFFFCAHYDGDGLFVILGARLENFELGTSNLGY